MNSIAQTAFAMILGGALLLVLSLMFASRIIAELPLGDVRRWWNLLRALIILFIPGYAVSAALVPHNAGGTHLVFGVMFFCGALFALLVTRLMLRTVFDVRRIAALEMENVTDPLLNIYNRRYMEQRLREEVSRANRYDMPLSLFILDIDLFKRINDSYGHPIGDQVLKELCALLRNKVREVDLFARYGGEEFVVIMPNTRAQEALALAERLRRAVEESTMVIESGGGRLELQCTISAGLATATGAPCEGGRLLDEADRALYRAKAAGRNRVALHAPAARAA